MVAWSVRASGNSTGHLQAVDRILLGTIYRQSPVKTPDLRVAKCIKSNLNKVSMTHFEGQHECCHFVGTKTFGYL